MTDRLLHEGRPCAEAAATSRALHYGDGVFRTLLWFAGEAVDWPLHCEKLAQDCAALALQMPAPDMLADEVRQVAGTAHEAVIKIIVARRSSGRGYRPATAQSERWVMAYPAPAPSPQAYERGVDVALSPVRLAQQPLLAGVKHLNRLDQVLASRDWPAGIDELLMCDAADRVICGTRSNLLAVIDGALATPCLDRCGVAGIMRRRILEHCVAIGLSAREVELKVQDLDAADELLVCNALIGIWPVRSIAGRLRPAPGPLTRQLMQSLPHPRHAASH